MKEDFFTKAFRDHKVASWWVVIGIVFLFISFPISIIIFAIVLFTLYKEKNKNKESSLNPFIKVVLIIAIIGIISSIVLASLNSARIKGSSENQTNNNQIINIPVSNVTTNTGPQTSFWPSPKISYTDLV